MEKYSAEWKMAQRHWVQDHKASNGDRIYKIHYIEYDTEYCIGEYFTAKDARDEMIRVFGPSRAAAALGRKGGSAKSEAKARAAKENAKKGGWPKGRPRKPSTDK
jgi:hypothetical protein